MRVTDVALTLTSEMSAVVPASENVDAAGVPEAVSSRANVNVRVSTVPAAEIDAVLNVGAGAAVVLVTAWLVKDAASRVLRLSMRGGESGWAYETVIVSAALMGVESVSVTTLSEKDTPVTVVCWTPPMLKALAGATFLSGWSNVKVSVEALTDAEDTVGLVSGVSLVNCLL